VNWRKEMRVGMNFALIDEALLCGYAETSIGSSMVIMCSSLIAVDFVQHGSERVVYLPDPSGR